MRVRPSVCVRKVVFATLKVGAAKREQDNAGSTTCDDGPDWLLFRTDSDGRQEECGDDE